MARFDYNKEHFEQVKVCGIPCLFNDACIDRSTVPKGKYLYEIGGDDDSGAEPARVKRVIYMVNQNHSDNLVDLIHFLEHLLQSLHHFLYNNHPFYYQYIY